MSKRLRLKTLAPAAAIAVVWGAAFWWPTTSQIDDDDRQAESLGNEQLALRTEIVELQAAQDELSSFESDLARFAVAVPSEDAIGSFVRIIDAAADDAEVRIDLFAPTNVVNSTTASLQSPLPSSFSAITLTMTAVGGFANTMTFLNNLESQPRLVVIDTMSLTSADDSSEEVVLEIEFRVFTTEDLLELDAASLLDFEEELS